MRTLLQKRHFVQICLAYILTILIATLTYLTGGTKTAIVTSMYIPVVIASMLPYRRVGLVHAIISGLLVGPIMPMDVSTGIPQPLYNWLLRLILFSMISFIITTFVQNLRREYERNNQYVEEMAQSHLATIYALVKISESRDDETGAHIERVSHLCKLLATKMREHPMFKDAIDDNFINLIHLVSPLHDIGKVGVPDHILLKKGRLTDEEFKIIKKHPLIGSRILFEVYKNYPNNQFLQMGYEIVRFHHERYDGKGYPDGLMSNQIPLSARIMAIVDVFDALRSKRIYKESFAHDQCIEIIRQERGRHFDPYITDIFLEHHEEFSELYDRITSSTKNTYSDWLAYRSIKNTD